MTPTEMKLYGVITRNTTQTLLFVGREMETRTIQRGLRRGENVILSGRYGIGRTRLVHHVAAVSAPHLKFVFADFSGPTADVARALWRQIGRQSKTAADALGFKGVVARPADLARGSRNIVVVFDNIARLTVPKRRFIPSLTLFGQLRYIAIVDSYLPQAHFICLKGCLVPSVHLDLKYLLISEVCRYFAAISGKYGRDWDPGMIEGMASATGGYPLAMTQRAERELALQRRFLSSYWFSQLPPASRNVAAIAESTLLVLLRPMVRQVKACPVNLSRRAVA